MSYFAISTSIGKIYYFQISCSPTNISIVAPNYLDCAYANPSIVDIGKPYQQFLSVYRLYMVYSLASTNRYAEFQLIQTNFTTYTLRMFSNGLQLIVYAVQGILFDPALMDSTLSQTVLVY